MEEVDNSRQKPCRNAILGIYAKQPLPGQCKTRLCPPLSATEAADLYACFLRETVSRMQAGNSYDLAICYAGQRSWFEQAFPGLLLVPQQGADLGARMAASLSDFIQQGYQRAVLIGSDAPDLPLELVEQAFVALRQTEVVLAPATDGGYVLIGESTHRPELFSAIHWSTGTVLTETRQRITQYGIKAVELDCWEDLDDLQDLSRFLRRSPEAKTAAHLRQQLAQHFSAIE